MKNKTSESTAAEFMTKLASDPEYQERRRKLDEEFERRAAELAQAEEPLLVALQGIGINARSIWSIKTSTKGNYGSALPLLLEHLQRPYPPRIREGIARALGIPAGLSFWAQLLKIYEQTNAATEAGVKEGLACAISSVATDDVMNDVVRLIRDQIHGPTRIHLLRALSRSRLKNAKEIFIELKDDPTFSREIQERYEKLARKAK